MFEISRNWLQQFVTIFRVEAVTVRLIVQICVFVSVRACACRIYPLILIFGDLTHNFVKSIRSDPLNSLLLINFIHRYSFVLEGEKEKHQFVHLLLQKLCLLVFFSKFQSHVFILNQNVKSPISNHIFSRGRICIKMNFRRLMFRRDFLNLVKIYFLSCSQEFRVRSFFFKRVFLNFCKVLGCLLTFAFLCLRELFDLPFLVRNNLFLSQNLTMKLPYDVFLVN